MPYHILIADDTAFNRKLVKNILSHNLKDAVFEEANNGLEVLDIVSEHSIDLIILDLIMPILDGYETLRKLKNDERFQSIPVIVNSAITEIESIQHTLQEGAVDYFTKPLSEDDMNIILPLKARNALLLYEQNQTIINLNKHINDELIYANSFANSILPKSNRFQSVEFFTKYYPSLAIGGDFFDCIEQNGRFYFIVADVTGHGIAAGMASSMLKILYRKAVEAEPSLPHQILDNMNQSIFQCFDFSGMDNYIAFTAFTGMIENNQLAYSNAGHPYPVIYRADTTQFEVVKQNGFLVGMLEEATYETDYVQLSKDDLILLYTDGLFCAGVHSDFKNWDKVPLVSSQFKKTLVENPELFMDEIYKSFHVIHQEGDKEYNDDVSLMLIRLLS